MSRKNGHPMPTVPAIERAVLGAAMMSEEAAAVVVDELSGDHFYETDHRRVYEAIGKVFSAGSAPDIVSVHQALQEEGVEQGLDVHPSEYITEVDSTGNAGYWAKVIREKWMLRRMVKTFTNAAATARGDSADAIDLMDKVQRALGELMVGAAGETHIGPAIDKALDRTLQWEEGEVTDFAPSGIYTLDKANGGGLPKSELIWVAGFSGSGKTSLVVQMVRAVAQREARKENPGAIVFFSLEMTREQIVHRMAQNTARISTRQLRSGSAPTSKFEAYRDMLVTLRQLPIHCIDDTGISLSSMQARCLKIESRVGNIALIVTDYDEKQHAPGTGTERIDNIARGNKDIAKRFECPHIAISQYNNKPFSHGYNKYGTPSDGWLRGSGKKIHEAHDIYHWRWPGFWVEVKEEDPGDVDDYDPEHPNRGYLVQSKNRQGKSGQVVLYFYPQWTYFEDRSDPQNPLGGRHTSNDDTPF